MKLPANFYRPLAIGAPLPLRELPVRPERMIHFFPPHVEKIRARIPEMAKQIDVLCGNLEDAIPIDAKEAARARLHRRGAERRLRRRRVVDARQRVEQSVVSRRYAGDRRGRG
jgi:hypothetical protein